MTDIKRWLKPVFLLYLCLFSLIFPSLGFGIDASQSSEKNSKFVSIDFNDVDIIHKNGIIINNAISVAKK